MSFIHKLNVGLTSLLLFLSALSYHPSFFVIYGEGGASRSILSTSIAIVTLTILILSFRTWVFRNKVIKQNVIYLIFTFLFGLMISVCFESEEYINEIRNILIAFVFLVIGYCLSLSVKEFFFLFAIFLAVTLYSSTAQVATNIGGFIIEDQYLANAKNSLGVILGSICIGTVTIGFSEKRLGKVKYLLLGTAIFLFVLLLTIRARTSSLAVIIILGYYYIKRSKLQKKQAINFVLLFVVTLIFVYSSKYYSGIWQFVQDSFLQNREIDIYGGRTTRNAEALSVIIDYPIWGKLGTDIHTEWVHNYLLRILSEYGIIGSLPLLFLYTYYVFFLIKYLLRQDVLRMENIGVLIMLVPFFSSFTEPTFPFAPGTAVVFAFVTFGYTLRNNQQNRITNETLSNLQ